MNLRLLTICMLIGVAGCDKPSQTPAPQTKLFEDQRNALEKSKQVEDTVLEATQAQKKQTEEQTQ